jgi:hypothetical protein
VWRRPGRLSREIARLSPSIRRFHAAVQFYDAPAFDAANIELNAIYQAAVHGEMRGSLEKMRAAILPYVARVCWHGATGMTSF